MAALTDLGQSLFGVFKGNPVLATSILIATLGIGLYALYRRALPRPYPDIPYNEHSANRILGDLPDLISYMEKEDNGNIVSYWLSALKRLDSPIAQVFLDPFHPGKPYIVVADFDAAQEVTANNKVFDRAQITIDTLTGLAPDHHINKKTGPDWKAHRMLIQDPMTPSFLHSVAAPAIHSKALDLVQLWRVKAAVAQGRPFEAGEDMHLAALDAVCAFAFGEQFGHSATGNVLKQTKALQQQSKNNQVTNLDEPVAFPKAKTDPVLDSTMKLTNMVGEAINAISPRLWWDYLLKITPRGRKAVKDKWAFVTEELRGAVKRMEDEVPIRAAVDHMVQREKKAAEKTGRKPNYFNDTMVDETFGFIIAGHDTTSTALVWALKFLADNQNVQKKLRDTLHKAYGHAKMEARNPTAGEITSTQIPYLEAVSEEVLRLCGAVPSVERDALADTEVLGYPIPKGATLLLLTAGPTIAKPALGNTKKESKSKWDSDDITAFRPERWLAKNNGDAESFDPMAGPMFAFGGGQRMCYGRRLAYMEMKLILTLVLWNFELLPCPEKLSGYKTVLALTNRPKDCYVRLREVEY